MESDTKGLGELKEAVGSLRSVLDRLEGSISFHENNNRNSSSVCYDVGLCSCGHSTNVHNPFTRACMDPGCKCELFVSSGGTRWIEFSEAQ